MRGRRRNGVLPDRADWIDGAAVLKRLHAPPASR